MFSSWSSCWSSSIKKLGYSGTAILSRKPPLSVTYGLTATPSHDGEGRVITAVGGLMSVGAGSGAVLAVSTFTMSVSMSMCLCLYPCLPLCLRIVCCYICACALAHMLLSMVHLSVCVLISSRACDRRLVVPNLGNIKDTIMDTSHMQDMDPLHVDAAAGTLSRVISKHAC